MAPSKYAHVVHARPRVISLGFHMDGIVQDCSISSALAMGILRSSSSHRYVSVNKMYYPYHSL